MKNERDRKRGIAYARSASNRDNAIRRLVDQKMRQLGVFMRIGRKRDEVIVLDDAGTNGLAADTPGFRELIDLVSQGVVGAIFVDDVARRSTTGWVAFVAECEANDVEIVADGVVIRRGTTTEGGAGDAC